MELLTIDHIPDDEWEYIQSVYEKQWAASLTDSDRIKAEIIMHLKGEYGLSNAQQSGTKLARKP